MNSEAKQDTQSLGDVVGGLAADAQALIRGEIALARAEFDQGVHRMIKALVWLMGGALFGFAGLVVVLQGAAFALAIVIPAWAASLAVGIVIVIIGALFARAGLSRVSLRALAPERTAANLEKDAQVIKEHA
jgi:Putative Actinobacterial Holin-X, holin superfamily III